MNELTGFPPAQSRIAVVFGGRSSEHAISCVTAGSVLRVLDPERYEVLPIGISTGRSLGADGRGQTGSWRSPTGACPPGSTRPAARW